MFSDKSIAVHAIIIFLTSEATVMTGPPNVTSSRKPSVNGACKDNNIGWMVSKQVSK